jgi:type IV pilus assembly protein PilB
MISEVRDLETGMIAAEAVLAGTLVFSAILAGDALSAITRLFNFGLSPYWVGNSVIGIIHQKLLRKICTDCMEQYEQTEEEMERLGTALSKMFKGKGCESCNGTGYHERTGIHEILVIDDKLRDLIYRQASFLELKEAALAGGFEDIRTDAVKKARAGITTLPEILRALG